MVLYRGNFVPGGTYFFTVTLADRRSDLLVRRVDLLREAFRVASKERPMEIVAVAILPEHPHTIWTLPEGDRDFPGRWRRLKGWFTRRSKLPSPWQSRYWEHTIRDERDLANHVDYIHYNPVRHGLVRRVADWPHSSFHQWVGDGRLPADWAASPEEASHGYGE